VKSLPLFFGALLISFATIAQKANHVDLTIKRILSEPVIQNEDEQQNNADSLGSVFLACDTISSDSISDTRKHAHKWLEGLISFTENNDGTDDVRMAYYSLNIKKWIVFSTPFSDQPTDVYRAEINKSGYQVIIIKGEKLIHGSGIETSDHIMLIINIIKRPIQLLKLTYGFEITNFGNVNRNGAGSNHQIFTRQVSISNEGLKIYTDQNVRKSDLSIDIPDGRYVLVNDRYESANEEDFIKINEKLVMEFNTLSGKRLVISADKDGKYIVYRFGSQNHVELQFPNDLNHSYAAFKLSTETQGKKVPSSGFSYTQIHFSNGGFTYNIFNQFEENGNITKSGLIVEDLKTGKKSLIRADMNSLKGSLDNLGILENRLSKEYLSDAY
jgi:hypothetical protein